MEVYNQKKVKFTQLVFIKAKSNHKKLLRFKSDNKNNYKEGSLVSNFKIPGGKKQNKNVDMLFQITIE